MAGSPDRLSHMSAPCKPVQIISLPLIIYPHLLVKPRNKEDAEDVLHEAILKAFKKCHQIKDESRFFYWMLRIVRNEALTYKKHCMRHLLFMQSKFISNENIYEDSAEYLYFREKQNDRLDEKINALRSPEKEILKMRIYQKKAFPDIAKELNLNYHTVRSQYQRSIKKIKRILEENDYE